jgi:hypothetical protein
MTSMMLTLEQYQKFYFEKKALRCTTIEQGQMSRQTKPINLIRSTLVSNSNQNNITSQLVFAKIITQFYGIFR